MGRRLQFWRATLVSGYRWASDVTDHAGRIFLIAGILGAPAVVIALNHYPWWWTATGIGAALVLVLGEGAYRTWTDAMDRPAATAPSPRVPPLNHVHGLRDFATQQLGLVRRFGANDVDLEIAQGR